MTTNRLWKNITGYAPPRFLADLAICIGLSLRVIMRKREASITFFARLRENCALLVGPLL